jgi:uncharacterized protein YjiS (DUF1127 family)
MLAITPPAPSVRMARFVRRLSGVIKRSSEPVAGWIRRRQVMVLARADDRMLADLGLCRGDVVDAFSGPPWEDPTRMLRARALERRLAHHCGRPRRPFACLPSPSLAAMPLHSPADRLLGRRE